MNTFWHLVLPGKHNNYHPHLLRSGGLVFVALVIAIIPSFYNRLSAGSSQVLGYATAISTSEIAITTNSERAKAGLPSLSINTELTAAAFAKANDMLADDYWSHDAPDGTTPWSFIKAAGYTYEKAGENLAKDFDTSGGVVTGWMNSAPHRANILDNDFSEVGYGVVNGTLGGKETTLVVAMYGLAKQTSAPIAPTAEQTPTAPATSTPAPSQPTVSQPVRKTTEKPVASSPVPSTTQTKETTLQSVPASSSDKSGEVKSAVAISPAAVYSGMNWGQKASLFILSGILLLFILKHTLIWRANRKGVKGVWLRAHPLGQFSVIIVAIIATATSGLGSVL